MNYCHFQKNQTTKQEILKFSGVKDASTFAGSFGSGSNSSSGFTYNGIFVQPRNIVMDYNFLEMMKIKIVKGRDLSPKYASDTISNWLINETLAKKLGLKNPINTVIQSGWGNEKGNMSFKVVGVVKDFNDFNFHHFEKTIIHYNIPCLYKSTKLQNKRS